MFKYIALILCSTSCFATDTCMLQLQMAADDASEMSMTSDCILERNYYAGVYDGLEYAIKTINEKKFEIQGDK